MKRITIYRIGLLVAFLLVTVSSQAQDFRNIEWGMSVDQVKKIEGGPVLDENESMFVYPTEVAGLNALLFFKHRDNKVIGGGYSFQVDYTDKNAYINDYEDLKNLLIEEYGNPTSDEVLWKNDLFKDDLENHGLAVGKGYLIYWADWDIGDTTIELALHGNNNLHILSMNYASARDQVVSGGN